MGFFDSLLKVVSTVAPFVPGGQAVGAIAGAASGLSEANKARKNANKQAQAMQGQSQQSLDLVNQYLPDLLKMYSSLATAKPASVNGANLGDPYGLIARARNTNPYNEGIQRLLTGREAGRTALDAQGAVNALKADTNSLGVVNSSDLVTGIRRIRQAAANNIASTRADLAVKGAEYNAAAGGRAEEETYNRRMGEENSNFQRGQLQLNQIGSMLPILLQLQNGGIGALGGLQQMYASRADSIGGSLGNVFGELGKAGVFDFLKRRPTSAGDNTYGTNQAGTVRTPQGLNIQQPQYNLGVEALRNRRLTL